MSQFEKMDKRIDLRHIAVAEKEYGANKIFKGAALLIANNTLLAIGWVTASKFSTATKPNAVLHCVATIISIISSAALIWFIYDGLKDVKRAKKYLHEWDVKVEPYWSLKTTGTTTVWKNTMQHALQAINNGGSVTITDPKGNVLLTAKEMQEELQRLGYTVEAISPNDSTQ